MDKKADLFLQLDQTLLVNGVKSGWLIKGHHFFTQHNDLIHEGVEGPIARNDAHRFLQGHPPHIAA
jgi:hypothetical protein